MTDILINRKDFVIEIHIQKEHNVRIEVLLPQAKESAEDRRETQNKFFSGVCLTF